MRLGGSGSNDNNCGNINFDALHKAICHSTAAGRHLLADHHGRQRQPDAHGWRHSRGEEAGDVIPRASQQATSG